MHNAITRRNIPLAATERVKDGATSAEKINKEASARSREKICESVTEAVNNKSIKK